MIRDETSCRCFCIVAIVVLLPFSDLRANANAHIRPAEFSCSGREQGLLGTFQHLVYEIAADRRKALEEFFD